jgi:very-short-patch-repair endonuclease
MKLNRDVFKSFVKNIDKYSRKELKEFILKYNNYFIDESFLRIFIKYIFYNDEIIFNKQFSGTKYRPDIYIKNKNLIFEYDGPTHYTSNKVVINDIKRDNFFKKHNINVVRIPFFIEFNKNTIIYLFGLEYSDIATTYPNGFIHENVVLPSDFCERGIQRFKYEILKYDKNIGKSIYKSMINKSNILGGYEYVFTNSLEFLHNKFKNRNI